MIDMVEIQEWGEGIKLEVRVQPRSSRNQITGVQEGALKVKLTAPPVDGEANAALIEFLARLFGVSRGSVTILRGETGRIKLVGIHGLSAGEARNVLTGGAMP